jgi:8-oxo-dGTP pyrophosphatase MutT (NUDIX family)
MTLGVRGVVLNDRDEVFLVRHSYVAGWHFPGGGIEVGDTALQALAKELEEEANISPTDEPRLHGLFLNRDAPRDHIAVYIVRQFRQSGPRLADAEIVEAAFFPLAALPEHTTRSTRDRLAEIINGGGVSAFW